jgi:hypothetical protein
LEVKRASFASLFDVNCKPKEDVLRFETCEKM